MKLIGDRRSDLSKDISNFEYLSNWETERQRLAIPIGAYFVAGEIPGDLRRKVPSIMAKYSIFVQGYQFHNKRKDFKSNDRGYGQIFVHPAEALNVYEDDVRLCYANVYKAVGIDQVELVMTHNEWRKKEQVEKLFARICSEKGFTPKSDMEQREFFCNKSSWYFLKERTYRVWSMLINAGDPMDDMPNKVLVCDIDSGIPGVVAHEPNVFVRVE